MNMQTCITPQMIVDNWQTILPVTLLAIEYVMGLIPNSKAKGLSHMALLMYQNYRAKNPQPIGAPTPIVPPPGPPTVPPPAGPTT